MYNKFLTEKKINVMFTIWRAPSFWDGVASFEVITPTMNWTALGKMSLRFLQDECNVVWAAITGDIKSSKISIRKWLIDK